jgi:hypothetical protein
MTTAAPPLQPTLIDVRKMPPIELIDNEPIRAAAEAYAAAVERSGETRRNLDALDNPTRRQEVEDADARALVDAQAAKKADPGPKHAKAHEQAVSEARRHHDAAKLIESDRARDLQNAVTDQAYEWLVAIEEDDESTLERYRAALDDAERAAQQLSTNRAKRSFLNGHRFKGGAAHVYDGERQRTVGELLDLLRDVNGPPPVFRGHRPL